MLLVRYFKKLSTSVGGSNVFFHFHILYNYPYPLMESPLRPKLDMEVPLIKCIIILLTDTRKPFRLITSNQIYQFSLSSQISIIYVLLVLVVLMAQILQNKPITLISLCPAISVLIVLLVLCKMSYFSHGHLPEAGREIQIDRMMDEEEEAP